MLQPHKNYIILYLFLSVEPLRFAVGDRVINKYKLAGRITAVYESTRTYDVLYNDSRTDENIPEFYFSTPRLRGTYHI